MDRYMRMLTLVVGISVVMVGIVVGQDSQPATSPSSVKLPAEIKSPCGILSVSSDGEWAVVGDGQPAKDGGQRNVYAINLGSGKSVLLQTLISAVARCEKYDRILKAEFSGDGTDVQLMIAAAGDGVKGDEFQLIAIARPNADTHELVLAEIKVAKRYSNACWAGRSWCCSEILEDGTLASNSGDLDSGAKFYILPYAASSDGKTIVGAGMAGNISSTVKFEKVKSSGNVLVVSSSGKIIRDLGSVRSMEQRPVISPSGKFVAFLHAPSEPNAPSSVTVFPTDADKVAYLDTCGNVIGVTDDGMTVAQAKPAKEGDAPAIEIWNPIDGKKTILVEKSISGLACVVAGKVYFVAKNADGGFILNYAEIPKAKK